MSDTRSALEAELLAAREQFLAFVRSRVADPGLAEDILQDAMLRALRSLPSLRDEERLVPWFYRILRNGIVDAYRRQAVRNRHSAALPDELDLADEPSAAQTTALCECFRAILPTLRPEYAEVIERELAEESSAETAASLAITPNNLKVRRHRARRALRERLEQSCSLCAAHGCIDCTCEEGAALSAQVRAVAL